MVSFPWVIVASIENWSRSSSVLRLYHLLWMLAGSIRCYLRALEDNLGDSVVESWDTTRVTGFGKIGDDGAPLERVTGNNSIQASEKWII